MSLLFCTISAVLGFLRIRHVPDRTNPKTPSQTLGLERDDSRMMSCLPAAIGSLLAQIARRVGARRRGPTESALIEQLTIPIDPIPIAMDGGRI